MKDTFWHCDQNGKKSQDFIILLNIISSTKLWLWKLYKLIFLTYNLWFLTTKLQTVGKEFLMTCYTFQLKVFWPLFFGFLMVENQIASLIIDIFFIHLTLSLISLNEKWKFIFYIYTSKSFQWSKKFDLDNISHLNIFVPNIQYNVGSNSQDEMTTLECWDPFYRTFENVFESQNILQPTRPTYLTTYI